MDRWIDSYLKPTHTNIGSMPLDPCPSCQSSEIVKSGFKITRKGRNQRFLCKNCGSTFYSKGEKKK